MRHVTIRTLGCAPFVSAWISGCGPTVQPPSDAQSNLDALDARADASPEHSAVDASAPVTTPVTIRSPDTFGISDPSLTRSPDGTAWMSVTAHVSASGLDLRSTRLAHATGDLGVWQDDGVVNAADANPSPTNLLVQGPSVLISDPWSGAGPAWLLLWEQRIETGATSGPYPRAWVAMRTANAPTPVSAWSSPVKLFVGSAYDSADDVVSGPPLVHVDALAADISVCGSVFEPGGFARPDAIYVTLSCASTGPRGWRIIALAWSRGTSPWRYLGTFATDDDATLLGYAHFSASDFAFDGTDTYLLTSPFDGNGDMWGCFAFRVMDLSTGLLWREDGPPGIVASIRPSLSRPTGRCGALEALPGGIYVSSQDGTAPESWRVQGSGIPIP